jgi:uncharacterized membrane protein
MSFKELMTDIAEGFEVFGVLVLIAGFAIGFTRAGVSLARRVPGSQVYRSLRSFVGRTLLLGLEVLVAADLIRTVAVTPSWESVGVLAVIVLIRTFLSFALEVEIDGRLPWSRSRDSSTSGLAPRAVKAERLSG